MAFVRDIYYTDTDAETSTEVFLPKNYENDLLLILISQDNNSSDEFSINDTSWTKLFDNYTSGTRQGCFYKISNGNEEIPIITGTADQEFCYIVYAISDVDTNIPINSFSINAWDDTATPSSTTISLDSENLLQIVTWDSDSSKFIYSDKRLRFGGWARSYGNAICSGFYQYREESETLTFSALHEVTTEEGNVSSIIINSSSSDLHDFNKTFNAEVLTLYGNATDYSTFTAPSTFKDTLLGISCNTELPSALSHSTSTSAPNGYFIKATIDDEPSEKLWCGFVDDFSSSLGTTLDFTSNKNLINLQIMLSSIYFRKLYDEGVLIGFMDENGNYKVYKITTDLFKAYVLKNFLFNIFAQADEESGEIDWTKIQKMIVCIVRGSLTTQTQYIYIRRLEKITDDMLFFYGSDDRPYTVDQLTIELEGNEYDFFKNDISFFKTKIPIKFFDNYSIENFLLTVENLSGDYRNISENVQLSFYSSNFLSFSRSLIIGNELKTPLNIIIGNENDDYPTLKNSSFENLEINILSDYSKTFERLSITNSKINLNNAVFENSYIESSEVFLTSLSQLKTTTISPFSETYTIFVDKNEDDSMNFDCVFTSLENKQILFEGDDTTKTIEVDRTFFSSSFLYDTNGININVIEPQYTLTLTGIKEGSEVRIYDAETLDELAGVENTDSDTFVYKYIYTEDKNIIITVFSLNYIPIRIEYVISNSNSSLPVQQEFDRDYYNPA